MQYKDYYQILGVARDAPQSEIKRAYHKLARKYHPDVSKEANAEEHFKDLVEAYEVLKDPKKRTAYDQLGTQWQAGQEFKAPPGWQHFEFSTGDLGDLHGFSDFFQSLFGGESPFFRGETRRTGFAMRGEDRHMRLDISLEEAFHGAQRTLQLQEPVYDNQGRMSLRTHSLNVKIPAGIHEGQRIRLAGQGEPGMSQGPRGDLYLEVHLLPHRLYRPVKKDIYLNLPIAPWEAALGCTLKAPTLGGHVEVKIPPGSQSGSKLRLKGRGLPGTPPGDQYLVLQIMTPKAKTEQQRRLYRELAETFDYDPRRDTGVAP
ncbi:MAG: DnaJ C-terminal domain-containing protein [Pseudomonadota bacterium]